MPDIHSRRVVIAGGTGFLGTRIADQFVQEGFEVVLLSRSPRDRSDPVREVRWDGKSGGPWHDEIDGAFGVINLAGKSVDDRPTEENKKLIRESRLETTRALGLALQEAKSAPQFWLQASAVGYYGDAGTSECTESSPKGADFLARVVADWEDAFHKAIPSGVRGVVFRIGFVLGADGGALPKLLSLAKWGLGGTVGSGEQFVSWIHVDDVVSAFAWAAGEADVKGTMNLCAPTPVRNDEFMRTLRAALDRPWSPPVPAFAVRIGGAILRTDPDLALLGQRCSCDRLTDAGFVFQYDSLTRALQDLM